MSHAQYLGDECWTSTEVHNIDRDMGEAQYVAILLWN